MKELTVLEKQNLVIEDLRRLQKDDYHPDLDSEAFEAIIQMANQVYDHLVLLGE